MRTVVSSDACSKLSVTGSAVLKFKFQPHRLCLTGVTRVELYHMLIRANVVCRGAIKLAAGRGFTPLASAESWWRR